MRAYTPADILKLRIPELPLDGAWEVAFGRPSRYERWFIHGESASGKSTFAMLLAKKLCKYGSVAYLPLEERPQNLAFKRRIARLNMTEEAGSFRILEDNLEQLADRLKKPKSPHFIFIDSVQYTGLNFQKIKRLLLDPFPKKSFIFVSQTYKGVPTGKTANDLKYDAGVKIYTRGFRAYCSGRYIDDSAAYFTIWEEGADRFYLNNE